MNLPKEILTGAQNGDNGKKLIFENLATSAQSVTKSCYITTMFKKSFLMPLLCRQLSSSYPAKVAYIHVNCVCMFIYAYIAIGSAMKA